MTTVNDMTTLNAWFKTAYADKVKDLIPDNVIIAKEAAELPRDQQPGGDYSLPVNLTLENGVTKAASSAGAFALNAPVAMATKNATLAGSQFLLRSALDYETIFRSKNKNSFVAATKGVIQNMLKSAYFYQEVDMLWGQQGIATLSAVAGTTFTITTAEYAPGLWIGAEGRELRIESAAGVLRGTCSITGVDIENRQITVDAAPAGTAATDVVFFEADGASGANCMLGLYKIITPTTGTLFGINRATYSLWRGVGTYSAGAAALSFQKIMKAIAQGVNRGLGSDIREIDIFVHSQAYADLGTDQAALRRYDAKYSQDEYVNGAEKLTFISQAGATHIRQHPMMKEGYAVILPKLSKSVSKVGAACTPTFELPGMVVNGEKQYLRTMENNAGIETRVYWNCAAFTPIVHQMLWINNIVNAS
jgi:hypothetical protein